MTEPFATESAGTQSGPSDEVTHPVEPRRRTWLSRLRVTAVLLIALGLLGLGSVAGWRAHDQWAPKPTPVQVNASVHRPIIALDEEKPGVMPSIVGLTSAEARRVLYDSGIAAADVRSAEVPAAGEPGLVVRQDPAPGTDPVSGAVTVGIATPASVPDVIGKDEQIARTQLAGLGARVTVQEEYSPTAIEGTVLAVSPKVGSLLPLTTVLTVASAPSSVFVDQLEPITDDCYTDTDVPVNGANQAHAVSCQPGDGSPVEMDYVLNRKVTAFTAVFGEDDRGETGQQASVTIYRDGTQVRVISVDFGASTRVRIDVFNALRLRFVFRWVNPPRACCPDGPTVIMGDGRMIGSRAAIDALSKVEN